MKRVPFYLAMAASLFFIAWARSVCSAQSPAASPAVSSGPGKLVVTEPVFVFGAVPEGAVVKHEFEIRNSGQGALNISRVQASCGCTASAASKNVLQPGEAGSISAAFDTSGFSGAREKSITVVTDDPENQVTKLTLKGSVEPGVGIPEKLSFGQVAAGAEPSMDFTAEVQGQSQDRILGIKSFSRWVTAKEVEGDSRRKKFAVQITNDAAVGELRARLVLDVQNGDKIRSIAIPVFASIKGPLRLDPPVLPAGILEGSQPIEKTASLRYLGEGQIEIKDVTSTASNVKAEMKEVEKGRVYEIKVTIDPAGVTSELKAAVVVTAVLPSGKTETASLSVYGINPPK